MTETTEGLVKFMTDFLMGTDDSGGHGFPARWFASFLGCLSCSTVWALIALIALFSDELVNEELREVAATAVPFVLLAVSVLVALMSAAGRPQASLLTHYVRGVFLVALPVLLIVGAAGGLIGRRTS